MSAILPAPFWIQDHILAATLALGLGTEQLLLRKGGRLHHIRGYAWIGMMAALALSSFRINRADGRYS